MYRNISYSRKTNSITEWTWDEDGNPTVRHEIFRPFVYVETNDSKFDAISIYNTKLKKIEFKHEKDRFDFTEKTTKRLFYNIPVKQQYLLEKYKDVSLSEMMKYPLRIFFLDIEVYSPDTFPEADQANHPINVITIYDSLYKKFYTWGLNNDYDVSCVESIGLSPKDIVYINCSTEINLLESFLTFWSKNYPDLVTGWNSATFDNPYLVNRITKLLGDEWVRKLSPNNFVYPRTRTNLFDRFYNHWHYDGLADIDYLELYAKSEMNQHESYKLDYIGNYEEVDGKVSYESANLAELADTDWNRFITYNIQDVNIIIKLEAKKNYLKVARGKSYRGFSPLEKALDSVPIVTGMLAKAGLDEHKIIVTFKPNSEEEVEFQGGFVFPPSGKIHKGIVSFDVNSLYPNTMITLNTSPETKVGRVDKSGSDSYLVSLVNGKSKTVNQVELLNLIKQNNLVLTKANILFSQAKRGICAKFLDDLYKDRVRIKKEMEVETDPDKKAAMDIEQYLLKILLNSVYGVFGNRYFSLYDIDIASSVTLTGQAMIKKSTEIVKNYAKDFVHDPDFDIESIVVYGDSVTGDTPIIMKNSDGEVVISLISDITGDWIPYNNFKIDDTSLRKNKEQIIDPNFEVWSASGWTKIKRVIRHSTSKDIFRVVTHTGLVDVTEDHSLLLSNGTPIKPKDVKVGDCLLHNGINIEFTPFTKKLKDILIDYSNLNCQSIGNKKSFLYGFFYGDGSCGSYKYEKFYKNSWALNNSNISIVEVLKSALIDVYGGQFTHFDTLKSSGVYKIGLKNNDIKSLVDEYRGIFYNSLKQKTIPTSIINGSLEDKYWFLVGYFMADGYKCYNTEVKNLKFNNKGKAGLAGLIYILNELGYNVSVNDRSDKFDNYIINATTEKLRKPKDSVKKVYKIHENYTDFVYDIETEDGTFNTGTPLIVKNTDSNFFDFDKILNKSGIDFFINNDSGDLVVNPDAYSVIDSFEKKLNDDINEWAKTTLNSNDPRYHFSREKICFMGMFITKKNYILRVLNNEGKDCDKMVEKGVELVKSSHSAPIKELMRDIISCIFYEKGKSCANEKYIQGLELFKKLKPEDIAWRKNAKNHEKWEQQVNGFECGKGTPIHHKGAIFYNKLLKEFGVEGKYPMIKSGQKIKTVYLQKNKYGLAAISFIDELPEEFNLIPDYELQYSKMVTPLIQRCYSGSDWNLPDLNNLPQTDLFELLGLS